MFTNKRLILLDRDGVINQDSPHFIRSVHEWYPLPGSLQAIAQLTQKGYLVAVATNQSGIARGYYSLSVLDAIHQLMQEAVASYGGRLDCIVYCPHGPWDDCECRKPRPGLLLDCFQKLGVKAPEALMVGDAWRDMQAAQRAGCEAVLVRTGKGESTLTQSKVKAWANEMPGRVFEDLLAVASSMPGRN